MRHSRPADRGAKSCSLFRPLAAVATLAFNRTHCDALGEILLEDEEDDDDRHSGQRGTGHDKAEIGAVLCLQLCDAQRDGKVAGAGQHDELHEVVVPAVDEGEDGQCADARLDHRQHDADKGARLAGSVDAGRLQHFGGDALTELFHQEDAEGPAHDGENDGPDGVVELERAHLTQQRDEDDLLGQGHRADDEGEEQFTADEALFGQRITCHCCGDAGEDHGHDSHEHRVDHPAQGCRGRRADGEIDGFAVRAERAAERDRQLPQGCALAGEKLLVVGQHPLTGPPLRGGRVYSRAGLEGAGDDPVQREGEQHGHDADEDEGQDHVGAHLFQLAGVTLQRFLFFCSCSHCPAPPLIILTAKLELDSRQDGDDNGQYNAHCVAVTIAVELERGVVDIVHDGIGAVVGAAGGQQLDQREALEGVDGGDDQNVQGGGHDGGPLDLPEALEIRCAVHLGGFHDGLIHIAQRRNIQHDGLAHRGGEQNQDDTAQCKSLVTQPVDVLVDDPCLCTKVIENSIVIVKHPLPYNGNCYGTSYNRKIKYNSE